MEYINKEAKAEAKRRSTEQIGAVQDRLKKWANKVVVGGFYKSEGKEYKEGDVWEDSDGKKWTVKNGVKQSISKLQDAKMPWWCPSCGRTMNHKIHEKFYLIKGACHDCWVKYEGKMRIDRVYPAYERKMLRANERAWITDIIEQHLNYIKNQGDMQIHFMDGRWEVLADSSEFDEIKEKLQKDIQFMYERLQVLEQEEEDDQEEQKLLEEWQVDNPWNP